MHGADANLHVSVSAYSLFERPAWCRGQTQICMCPSLAGIMQEWRSVCVRISMFPV